MGTGVLGIKYMNISVLILTRNEEINLPDCLALVAWSDDIVVFDSFSNDRTVAIAQAAGARVVQRTFDHYAAQRNAALQDIVYAHPWILMLDADERVTPALQRELKSTLDHAGSDMTLYHVRRRDMFFGRWLRRSSGYPTWFCRVIRTGQVWVEREINEQYYTNGKVGFLQEHLVHYPFNKGIDFWVERHNQYSSMEALLIAEEIQRPLVWRTLWAHNPVQRRKALKQLVLRLPAHPFLVFLYLYVLRGGFLDGFPGFTFCWLRAFYESLITLKARTLRRQAQKLPV